MFHVAQSELVLSVRDRPTCSGPGGFRGGDSGRREGERRVEHPLGDEKPRVCHTPTPQPPTFPGRYEEEGCPCPPAIYVTGETPKLGSEKSFVLQSGPQTVRIMVRSYPCIS